MLKYTVLFLIIAFAATGISIVQKDVEEGISDNSYFEQFFTGGDNEDRRPRSNRTWKEVGECLTHNDQICVLKFPKTTAAERKCFINATIGAEFAKAGVAFEKCLDKKIGSGDKCLEVGRYHKSQPFEQLFADVDAKEGEFPELLNEIDLRSRRFQLPAYTHCQMVEQWECKYGCRRLWGPNARKFRECGRETFKKAIKMFVDCELDAE